MIFSDKINITIHLNLFDCSKYNLSKANKTIIRVTKNNTILVKNK